MSRSNMTNLDSRSFISDESRILLKWSLLSAAFWGIIGHAYFFLSDAFSFDAIHTIGQSDINWKISLGRFAQPLYKTYIRGNIQAPWLIGLLTILYLGLAVYFLCRLLNISSKWSVFACTSILAVNLQVIVTITSYIHETDVFMLAFLLEVIAVYLWKTRKKKTGFVSLLIGALLLAFSFGLYQAYVSAGVALVLIVLISECFTSNIKAKSIVVHAVTAVLMSAAAGIIYYLLVRLSLDITGYALSADYNSLDNLFNYSSISFLQSLLYAYTVPLEFLFTDTTVYSPVYILVCNWILLIITLILTFLITFQKRIKCLYAFILIGLLPLSMGMIKIMNPEAYYELMIYSYFLFYVLAIMTADTFLKSHPSYRPAGIMRYTCIILTAVIALCNVRFSNQVYLKKDLESEAVKLYMTELNTVMDNVEGYEPGVTGVLFLTQPEMPSLGYDFGNGYDVIPTFGVSSFYSTRFRFEWYYQFILQRKITFIDDADEIARFKEILEVQDMLVYPAKGSIQMIDWTLVVNLSENDW